MSEEMENQPPTQAPSVPFRRRRPSRRRSGRRNDSERAPAAFGSSSGDRPERPGGPDALQEDSREIERRREDAAEFLETEGVEENRRERSEGASQNGEGPPR